MGPLSGSTFPATMYGEEKRRTQQTQYIKKKDREEEERVKQDNFVSLREEGKVNPSGDGDKDDSDSNNSFRNQEREGEREQGNGKGKGNGEDNEIGKANNNDDVEMEKNIVNKRIYSPPLKLARIYSRLPKHSPYVGTFHYAPSAGNTSRTVFFEPFLVSEEEHNRRKTIRENPFTGNFHYQPGKYSRLHGLQRFRHQKRFHNSLSELDRLAAFGKVVSEKVRKSGNPTLASTFVNSIFTSTSTVYSRTASAFPLRSGTFLIDMSSSRNKTIENNTSNGNHSCNYNNTSNYSNDTNTNGMVGKKHSGSLHFATEKKKKEEDRERGLIPCENTSLNSVVDSGVPNDSSSILSPTKVGSQLSPHRQNHETRELYDQYTTGPWSTHRYRYGGSIDTLRKCGASLDDSAITIDPHRNFYVNGLPPFRNILYGWNGFRVYYMETYGAKKLDRAFLNLMNPNRKWTKDKITAGMVVQKKSTVNIMLEKNNKFNHSRTRRLSNVHIISNTISKAGSTSALDDPNFVHASSMNNDRINNLNRNTKTNGASGCRDKNANGNTMNGNGQRITSELRRNSMSVNPIGPLTSNSIHSQNSGLSSEKKYFSVNHNFNYKESNSKIFSERESESEMIQGSMVIPIPQANDNNDSNNDNSSGRKITAKSLSIDYKYDEYAVSCTSSPYWSEFEWSSTSPPPDLNITNIANITNTDASSNQQQQSQEPHSGEREGEGDSLKSLSGKSNKNSNNSNSSSSISNHSNPHGTPHGTPHRYSNNHYKNNTHHLRNANWLPGTINAEYEQEKFIFNMPRPIQHPLLERDVVADYHINHDQILGEGSYAVVYAGIHIESNCPVAIKCIRRSYLFTEDEKLSVKREIENMIRANNHRNLIHLMEVFETLDYIYLITDRCTHGSLEQMLQIRRKLTELETMWVMRQCIEAINYCHSVGVVHCDVKPQNILLTEPEESDVFLKNYHHGQTKSQQNKIHNGTPLWMFNSPLGMVLKVCDFGLSRKVPDVRFFKHTGNINKVPFSRICGTGPYLSPEIMLKKSFGKAADMWSIGIVCYRLLTGTMPFLPPKRCLQVPVSFSGKVWEQISKDGKDFIQKLLNPDPVTRYTAKQALDHPWMRATDGLAPDL